MSAYKNWARNLSYSSNRIYKPETAVSIQQIVKENEKVKALGTRHSFNKIADTNTVHISLENLNKVIALDREKQTVTIEAGMRYGELCQYLHAEGFALHNLASLPHISVVGACATATHGSGDGNGNLATAVSAIEFIQANGEVVTLTRTDATFMGAVVNLGALGIVTKITLEIEPTYNMRQDLYENLPFTEAINHFDAISSKGYSVSFFTDWQDDSINQVWAKNRVNESQAYALQPELFGALPATNHLHPLPEHAAENCTLQLGMVGPWFERLPHFRMEFTPSSGEELQSEYFVARPDAVAALQAINTIREHIAPHLFISEIRTIAADNLWMSPCFEQDSIAIHFTWKPKWTAVQKILPLIETQLAPFNAKPHWGKLFTMSPSNLQSRYTKLADFRKLIRQYDPNGKFSNSFLENYIWELT